MACKNTMKDNPVYITLLTIELMIPYARSLKAKRSALRGLTDRIRSNFNASVAEVGYQDKWQRAVVAVCFVGSDKRHLEADTARLRTLCGEARDIEITSIDQEWL